MTPIILISGWAVPGAVLHPVAASIERAGHPVTVLSLPGFGYHDSEILNWEQMENWAVQRLPEDQPAILAGWSMGGNLATILAGRFPKKVKGLVTIASNPCFVEKEKWTKAMPLKDFNYFRDIAERNIQRGLKNFVGLCTRGASDEKKQADVINRAIGQQPFYASALLLWLKWLGESDHRSYLRKVTCPVRHILAAQDYLVPPELQDVLKLDFSWHDIQVVEGSHAFFIDDPDAMCEKILSVTESK